MDLAQSCGHRRPMAWARHAHNAPSKKKKNYRQVRAAAAWTFGEPARKAGRPGVQFAMPTSIRSIRPGSCSFIRTAWKVDTGASPGRHERLHGGRSTFEPKLGSRRRPLHAVHGAFGALSTELPIEAMLAALLAQDI